MRILPLLFALTTALPAAEFTARWIGAADGNWSASENWDIGRVPQNTPTDSYDVVWDNHAVTVTLNQDTVIRNFTFASGGRLQGQSSQTKLTIAGNFVWSQGVLAIRDRTTVQTSATIQGVGANFRTLETGRLWLQGRTDLRSGLHLVNGARVVNDSGALFEAHDGARFSTGGNLASDLLNLGRFRATPGAQSFISPQFRNEGLLEVIERTLEFASPGASVDQRAGQVRLRDATVDGLLNIMAGSLEGSGFVREAIVLGRVSGRLTFGNMTPGNSAVLSFKISGRFPEESDRFSSATALQLGGRLELTLFRSAPAPVDVIEIASAPGGVLGRFNNVDFGERVQVANASGSFRLRLAPDSKAVTLSDYRSSPPPRVDTVLAGTARKQCQDCFMCFIYAVFGVREEPGNLRPSSDPNLSRSQVAPNPLPPLSSSLAVFRALQSLLGTSPEGRRLADLFWRHTSEIVEISLAHPEVLMQANLVVRSFQPGVAALLARNGPAATITPVMIDQLDLLWNMLADNASPALREILLEERARFDDFQRFLNQDFSQWARLLQVPVPVQPWVHLSRPAKSSNRFSVEVNTIPGLAFSLWRSPNLIQWELVPSAGIENDEFTTRLIDPASPSENTFYTVRP